MASVQELTEWLSAALQKLWRNDAELFDIKVGERTIVGLLFHYLKQDNALLLSPCDCNSNVICDRGWDLEYNRQKANDRSMVYSKGENNKGSKRRRKFVPDLIFHKRNCSRKNDYAIEVKCFGNVRRKELNKDFQTLKQITELEWEGGCYRYGVSLIVDKNKAILIWIIPDNASTNEYFQSIIYRDSHSHTSTECVLARGSIVENGDGQPPKHTLYITLGFNDLNKMFGRRKWIILEDISLLRQRSALTIE